MSDDGEIIDDQSSGDLAVIGEGTSKESKVSFQVLQGIYHELTGKSENVSKTYGDSFQIKADDFNQLNYYINQCVEQYNIKAETCSIKVYYSNDVSENFSSFDRFNSFHTGITSSVESVLLNYNFLVVLPKSNKPQSYTVSIRIASRIAIEKKMKEMPFEFPRVLRQIGSQTAVVNIEYIDYAVARNILTTVDQWFSSLKKEKTSILWKKVTRNSHLIPIYLRYLIGGIVSLLIFKSIDIFVPVDASLQHFSKFIVASFIGIFASYKIAQHIGSMAETSLDNWSELSYISLTSGDEQLIEDAKTNNSKSIKSTSFKIICAIAISIIAKIIVELLPL